MEVLVLISISGFVVLWLMLQTILTRIEAKLALIDDHLEAMEEHVEMALFLKSENFRMSRRLTQLESQMNGLYERGDLIPN
jgi:hypothetical protein